MALTDLELKGKLNELTKLQQQLIKSAAEVSSRENRIRILGDAQAIQNWIIDLSGDETSSLVERASGEGNFASFFADIGRGLAQAQRELDMESVRYLGEIKNKPHLRPTVFRAPSLSGTLKLGMREAGSKGFNLILASKSEMKEKYQEQEIKFEVAAVPPPVEALTQLKDPIQGWNLILNTSLRDQIFAAVDKILKEGGQPFGTAASVTKRLQAALQNRWRMLLVESGADDQVLLAALYKFQPGGAAQADYLEIWSLTREQDAGLSLSSLFHLRDASPKQPLARLIPAVANLLDQQETFLKAKQTE